MRLGHPVPLDCHWTTFNVKQDDLTPHSLVQMIFTANRRKSFVPSRNFETYISEARRLLIDIEPGIVLELLELAYQISYHPFGVAFLRRLYESRYLSKT